MMPKKILIIIIVSLVVGILMLGGYWIYTYPFQNNGLCRDSISNPIFFPPWASINGSNDYYAYRGCVFYSLTGNILVGMHKLGDADLKSFQVLGGGYAKDKNQVYFKYGPLNGSDPFSFSIINEVYAKDKNQVYYNDDIIFGADILSFVTLDSDHPEYAKDKNQVYYFYRIIPGANPSSFRILNHSYSRDDKFVFYSSTFTGRIYSFIVQGANPDDFQIDNSDYPAYSFATSGNWTYLQGIIVSNKIDARSFKWLGGNYYLANISEFNTKNIFYEDKIVSEADIGSFSVIDSTIARDRNYCYLGEKITSCNSLNLS